MKNDAAWFHKSSKYSVDYGHLTFRYSSPSINICHGDVSADASINSVQKIRRYFFALSLDKPLVKCYHLIKNYIGILMNNFKRKPSMETPHEN